MSLRSVSDWMLHKCELLADSLSFLASVPEVKATSSTILDYAFSELK
jgi:hypothetical protein